MKIGYARVSSVGQNLERQVKQLKEGGCEIIYEEKLTGRNTKRPELNKMLEKLKKDDEILVTELNRISRSTRDLFKLVDKVKEKGATIKSISEPWLDTSNDNPHSKMLLGVMSSIAEFEVNLSKMRQAEGIAVARAKGITGGRPREFNKSKVEHAIELHQSGDYTVNEICEITDMSRATFYRRLKEAETEI